MTYKELRKKIFHAISDQYDSRESHNIVSYLMEESLGWKRKDWVLHADEPVSEDFITRMSGYAGQLKKNTPVQYILGHAYFLDLKLKINPSVLIPRPETEELVHWILEECKGKNKLRILDVGTGSGCIALALKHRMKTAEISALDFSENALHIAIENARRLKLGIHFVTYNITGNGKTVFKKKFDVIVSNPPYILPSEKNTLSKNVLDFEPHEALFTPDEDPLFFYRHIIEFATKNLVNGGKIFFELAPQHVLEIKSIFEKSGLFSEIVIRNDMQGKQRMIRSVFSQ